MSAAQAAAWIVVAPALAVCGGVALAWSILRVGEWRDRRRAAERYRLDRRISERLRSAAGRQT